MGGGEIPPQQFYLYNGAFTAVMDGTLLRSLVGQKNADGWKSDAIPEEALQVARLTVNHYHGTSIGLEDVVQRKHELLERFQTYQAVANFKGAQPDWTNNRVNADDKIWKKMYKKMPLAKAYRHAGDPEFPNLMKLFGTDKIIKEEGAKNVIQGSSTVRLGSEGDRTLLLNDDEEVTSRVIKAVARKLFDDTQESTTNVDPRFVFVPPKEGVQFPPRNFINFKYVSPQDRNDGSQGASSCGSNSTPNFVWGPFH